MPLPKKIKIKGPKEGYCNICREYGKLTEDHIPPKGCVQIKPIEIRTLSQEFYGKKLKVTISQNGVKFRTICAKCNNEILGANYDLELNRFTDEVKLFLKATIDTGLHFPLSQPFEVKTQKLLRAIVGHNLAGFLSENFKEPLPQAPFPDALRDYFLNESQSLSPRVKIYCWLFPVYDQIHFRGIAKKSMYRKEILLFDLLKFFPLAYWITWDQSGSIKIDQLELTANRNMGIDQQETLRINFSKIPKRNYPEAPEDYEFLMFNDQHTTYSKFKKT